MKLKQENLYKITKIYNSINPRNNELKDSLSSFYAVNKKILKIPFLPSVFIFYIKFIKYLFIDYSGAKKRKCLLSYDSAGYFNTLYTKE